MNEDRFRILKMVQEGRISAEEAAALIDALEGLSDKGAGTIERGEEGKTAEGREAGQAAETANLAGESAGDRTADVASETPSSAGAGSTEEAGKKAEGAKGQPKAVEPESIESFGEALGERLENLGESIERTVEQSASKLEGSLSKLEDLSFLKKLGNLGLGSIFGGIGPRTKITEEFTGELADTEGRPTEVIVETQNGGVDVQPWNSAEYKVIATKTVVATSEDEARRLSEGAVEVTNEGGSLRIIAHKQPSVNAVSFRVFLPAKLTYDMHMHSTNGGVKAERLRLGEARISTTNGSVKVSDLVADELRLKTTNGSCKASAVTAKTTEAKTTNGSIRWGGAARELSLRTTNGSVKAYPTRNKNNDVSETPSRYQIGTSNGSVTVEFGSDMAETPISFQAHSRASIRAEGDWKITREVKSPSRRELAGECTGSGAPVEMELSTNNGSIKIYRNLISQSEEPSA